MPTANDDKIDIVSALTNIADVYGKLREHPDQEVQKSMVGLESAACQVTKIMCHFQDIVNRAMELEDRKILLACSLLGILENRDARTGEVRP